MTTTQVAITYSVPFKAWIESLRYCRPSQRCTDNHLSAAMLKIEIDRKIKCWMGWVSILKITNDRTNQENWRQMLSFHRLRLTACHLIMIAVFLHRGKKTTLVPGLLDYYPQYCYLIWYAVSDLTISLAVRLPERSLNKNYRAWRVTEFIRWVDHWIRKRAQLPVSCKPNLFHLILRLIMSRRRWPLRLSAMLNH